jgi:hypothetical protein
MQQILDFKPNNSHGTFNFDFDCAQTDDFLILTKIVYYSTVQYRTLLIQARQL